MIERDRPEDCMSDLVLDRIVAGELAGADRARADAHLAGCARCTARRDELAADAAQFATSEWIEGAARRVAIAAGVGRPRWQVYAAIAIPLAAAAAIAIWIALPDRTRVSEDGVRIKGGVALDVVAQRPDGTTERLGPGARAAAGDAVRFVVSIDQPGHLVVLGLDSAGAVSPYVSAPIAAGRDQAQPGSIILDATPGFERFVAVVCPQPVELTGIAASALAAAGNDPRRIDRLAVDPACAQASFLVEKVVP